MSLFTQRTTISAGLATLALSLAPTAHAQIAVTGGVIDGQAAFFKDTGNNQVTSLFDIAIDNLQIVSPNGVLTNPLFQPTATGGFTDAGVAGTVDAGDTGLIVGKLSGIGFTENGSVVPFSQVDTALAYQVSAFTQSSAFAGTLIDGDAIPQLFIPVENITSDVAGIETTTGEMQIGTLNSNITAGVIDLPSTLQLQSSSSAIPTFFAAARKIKFEFKGEDVTPNALTFAGGDLTFQGEANKKFKIETFGDGGSSSFKLDANTGFVDIALGNAQETSGAFADIDAASPLDYKIKGQTEGILALFDPTQVSVSGTGRNTTFEFTQGSDKFKGNTNGDGDVTLFAAAGATNVDIDSTTVNFTNTNFSAYQSAISSTSYTSVRNTTALDFTTTTVPLGSLTLAFNVNFTLNGSGSFESDSSTSSKETEALIAALIADIDIDSLSNSSTISVFQGGSPNTVQYEVVNQPTYTVRVRQNRRGRAKLKIKVRNKRGRRIIVALRGDALAGCFEQIGAGSRMFPGLQGLRQLSDEEAAAIYEELLLEEADKSDDDADDKGDDDGDDGDDDDGDSDDDDNDGDDSDDSDDNDDSDNGDDDGDSDDDDDDGDDSDDGDDDTDDDDGDSSSDDAPAAPPAPIFEGLDSLSPDEVDAINDQL